MEVRNENCRFFVVVSKYRQSIFSCCDSQSYGIGTDSSALILFRYRIGTFLIKHFLLMFCFPIYILSFSMYTVDQSCLVPLFFCKIIMVFVLMFQFAVSLLICAFPPSITGTFKLYYTYSFSSVASNLLFKIGSVFPPLFQLRLRLRSTGLLFLF